MRTKTKALVLSLCAVLLVVTTVFVTMAFLTSQDSVQNTFTVGEVTISLDELDVDDDSNTEDNKTYTVGEENIVRDKANEYKLIPSKTYTKDPTIHVGANSEPCYLFVKVENGLVNAEADGETTIAAQMKANGWTLVDGQTNIYVYEDVVTAETGANVVVFKNFTIDGETVVEDYMDAKIKVTAYAIQAEGFENTATADIWAKF